MSCSLLLLTLSSLTSLTSPCTLLTILILPRVMCTKLVWLVHCILLFTCSQHTRNSPTYTKLEWPVHHNILSFTVRTHAMSQKILNGLSIVFYRPQSAHTQCSDVNVNYQQVWGSLRLTPVTVSGDSTTPYVTAFAKTVLNHTRTEIQVMAEH